MHTLRTYFALILAILIWRIVAVNLLIFDRKLSRVETSDAATPWARRVTDLPGTWRLSDDPPFVRMHIENTHRYPIDGDSANAEWASLFPGNGEVFVDKKRQTPHVPSMFYQLRCLDIIRREIVALEAIGGPHPDYPTELGSHCVNYLRQMALCRADTDMDVVLGANGNLNVYPDAHICRDWSVLYDELRKNQAASV